MGKQTKSQREREKREGIGDGLGERREEETGEEKSNTISEQKGGYRDNQGMDAERDD